MFWIGGMATGSYNKTYGWHFTDGANFSYYNWKESTIFEIFREIIISWRRTWQYVISPCMYRYDAFGRRLDSYFILFARARSSDLNFQVKMQVYVLFYLKKKIKVGIEVSSPLNSMNSRRSMVSPILHRQFECRQVFIRLCLSANQRSTYNFCAS